MRKVTAILFVFSLVGSLLMAGGIVTNTNQSAAYMRTLNRNAVTDVDAAYFNPAGLTRMCDGLHLGLSNQSIFQAKDIENSYPYLNTATFTGEVAAPVFPNFYAVYKMDKLALSAGFQPIGGGGSANFEDGLPSIEIPVSNLKAQLGSNYRLDAAFEGSSIYYGGQANAAYKINDMISVAVGGRFVYASNSYLGHVKDIEVQMGGTWMRADTYFNGAATQLAGAATSLDQLISAGASGMTLPQVQQAGYLSAAQVAELEAGLQAVGIDPTGYTVSLVQTAYNGAAAQMEATAAGLGDMEVDAVQKAMGVTPIVSVFITPMEGLDISLRYEMNTKLELENETEVDDVGMFPDGVKTRADIPAILAVGLSYKPMDNLRALVDFNYYFNTGADWAGREELVDNNFEAGVALEYCINEKLKASLGYLYGMTGATEEYQTDLSYSLSSSTIGLGAAYKVTPKIEVNVGGLNTFYQDFESAKTYDLSGTTIPSLETYMKTTFGFAVGVNVKL